MTGAKTKKGLFLLLFGIVSLPFLQHAIPCVESGPLKGGFKDAPDTVFTFDGWFAGRYQVQKERFLNDNTGFRSDLVRLNNQVDFSLFDMCHAVWTIRGRNHFLFQSPYLNAYYGNEFVGYDTILEKSRKLKAIQDTLGRLGKTLVLVYAPSKATFYPEYFPADRVQSKKGPTNCEVYRHIGDSLGIHQFDMDSWFLSMKNTSREMLFSKQGIHFTTYGAALASDSLIAYIEKLRNIHVPHPDWSLVEHSTEPRMGDDDVAAGLNLVFPVARETFAYPVIRDSPDTTGVKPAIIYIGDSYMFKLVTSGIVDKMNSRCDCWCYFKEVVEVNNKGRYSMMSNYDWQNALSKTDCVVLMYTAFNMYQLGNGFIEAAYDHFYPHSQ